MGRYNKTTTATATPTVATHQGGLGYKYDPKSELIAILATGLDNTFYEKVTDREKRLTEVLSEVAQKDPIFAAKALVYYRSVVGQRTVTHYGAVQMAKILAGKPIASRFFSKRDRKVNKGGIIYRLDDMLEISACYFAKNPGKPLTNAMKKGFKDALENADEYELAKYQAKSHNVSLVDLVNLVHPKPSEKMKPVFEKLMKGELKQFNTVEDKNTKAGQVVAAKIKAGEITAEAAVKELQEAKEDNYAELIKNRKIGYLALLRNLRNILKNTNNKELIKEACSLLTDEKLIKQSLVFPHQIDLALEIMLQEFSVSQMKEFATALNTAYELSIPNLSELFPAGKTAVVFDSSGSMTTRIKLTNNKVGSTSAKEKAALIAATLAKGIGADVYTFADTCHGFKFNPTDSVNSIKSHLINNARAGGGTYFGTIFNKIGDKYDRVFVISDMQGADELNRNSYKHIHIYSINIVGYGTTMFKPGNKVYSIYGYNSDIYELVKTVEIDPKALIAAIEAIEI